MTRRSSWGSVRRLPSGRFQAHRVGSVEHLAPQTFSTARDAHAFLAATRTAIERGAWIDVDAGTVPLADYATRWLRERAAAPAHLPSSTRASCASTSCRRWARSSWPISSPR